MRMIAFMVDYEKREAAPAGSVEGAKSAAGRRACLSCGERFASEGPHERICGPCKDTEEWRDLAAAARGHILW